MSKIDLTNLEERRKAVALGYIWMAPDGAVRHALRDIAAGTIALPQYIPQEWRGEAEALGVKMTSGPGLAEGQGPA